MEMYIGSTLPTALRSCTKQISQRGTEGLERVTQTPEMQGGKPRIRKKHVTVSMIVVQIAGCRRIDDLLADYLYLEREDVVSSMEMQRT